MVSIQNLPPEVILRILENVTISLTDVKNFSSTCTKFQWTSYDKNLWKKKYAERWPYATIHYEDKTGVKFDDANIKDLKKGMKCAKNLWRLVSRMSEMCSSDDEECYQKDNDIIYFLDQHEKKHPLNLYILHNELTKNEYHQDPSQCNTT
ncbi:uncharacterized protein LOC114934712 [Nylanderia fulva]|uniref:uncharacterized protein LOC114934712 n=1 Tax=Nylanderia fulva TaxID=613905 RepID=UPI0010FBA126|nr:uncharacterized protein LOC114934712 [Nylanderia fulva]